MKSPIKLVLMAGIAAGSLAIGSASPAPAAEVKKFEGTIALPAPILSNETAGDYATGGALTMVCPDPGDGDGVFYKFFDLGADYKFFFVSGGEPVVNEPDPTGVLGGSIQEYDLDLYVYDAKCNPVEIETGGINTGAGHAPGIAFKPARYAAVSYFVGPPNINVTLEASTERIKK